MRDFKATVRRTIAYLLINNSQGRQPLAEGLSPMVASASADLSSYALQGQ
ncbi:MAG: hypothetical protein LBU34_17415 [Planctomycetaceae bacterium]|nr:hypothetical protein [Planctomycetaceae bacterium]